MIKKMTLALLTLISVGVNAQDQVGIGTLTPTNTLDVNGDARVRVIDAAAATDKILVADANGVLKDSGITLAALAASAADGSETKVTAGTNVTVTGTGTTADPYVIVSTDTDTQLTETQVDAFVANNGYLTSFTEVDGSVTNEVNTAFTLTGTDLKITDDNSTLTADLSSFATDTEVATAITAGAADGSETIVNAGTNVTVTGAGTTASPYVIASAAGVEPWNKVGGAVAATANTDDAYLAGKGVIGGTTVLTYGAGGANDATLSVHGAIVTSTSVYADYVFEDYLEGASTIKEDYKFKTLSEVDSFIKTNKHLPGVTSIKDLQKTANGYAVNISALSVQVLEKTEELYLHTIEQQKTIDTLVKENARTSKENEVLKARLAKIEKALGI